MTSPLIVKAARAGQTIVRVTPESAGWRRVGFEACVSPQREVLGRDQH
jgi:5-deoxy-glucuronate isomerase